MYQHNYNPDMHRLSTAQHVSLDKHQNMVNRALEWQKHSRLVEIKNQPTSMTHLRLAFATLLNIFTK